MNLVIVESPTKAKTISKFLGSKYKVESSYGHIRDLPKSKLGVDIENNFEPQYVIPTKNRKQVNYLKREAEKADKIILATDEDREGEAIAFHLVEALKLNDPKKIERIVFHEITKPAIEEALKNPRTVNNDMVNAQQARRVLDRLVGYKLSPFLWEKVMKRLSAGRVQSVALRLIVEREEEIKKFKADEYWTISAILKKLKSKLNLEAEVLKINGETISKLRIKNKEEADKITENLKECDFSVEKINKKEVRKNPFPPFTTSTLQQEASKKLRYSAKQTMRLAQNLYENGLITYMRTDSLNLSKESVSQAANWINKNIGKEYALSEPRFFKTKSRLAQEAHEAIRPSNPELSPENLKTENSQEKKLYELIWRRFIASQMPQAVFNSTRVEILAKKSGKENFYNLNSNGNTLIFDGFLKIWLTKFEEKELPDLKESEKLDLVEVKPEQHFTEPPPRYNETSLIKILEEYGIGRPSTYAPTISVIQTRNYVIKNDDRRFKPTEIGEAVNGILVKHFPQIVDLEFTAQMEENLDKIAEGKEKWQKIIKEFYYPFDENLTKKYGEVEKQEIKIEETNEICEKCGKPMVVKYGRFGKFLACSGFPECKNAKTINNTTDEKGEKIKCPKCSIGEVIRKKTKRGRFFYGCSKWPDCDFASWKKPGAEEAERSED